VATKTKAELIAEQERLQSRVEDLERQLRIASMDDAGSRPDAEESASELEAETRERERAERTLEDREQHLRLILDNVPAAISYIDTEERFRFMSGRYAELGMPPDVITGKTLREAVGETAYETARKPLQRALAGETVRFLNTLSW